MKPAIKILWHEAGNHLAAMDMNRSDLLLLTVLDEDFTGINPFYSYPLGWLLEFYGWQVIGEL